MSVIQSRFCVRKKSILFTFSKSKTIELMFVPVWSLINSLTTKFFKEKKSACKKKKKKKNQDTWRDSNPRSRELELNALTTWLLHYIAILENYKTFITNLPKKFW